MHWQSTPYVLPVVISAIISTWVALLTWRRRHTPGATSFSLLMWAVAEWSLAYALELGSPDLPTKLYWDNISWLGAVCAPTLWLAFALQYTGRARWLTRKSVAILAVEPLVTLLLVWTNQFHGLIESKIRLDTSGSFSALVMTYGGWYWINIAYSYVLLLFGTLLICLLIPALIRSASLYWGQVSALLIAVLAPWVGNALTTFGWMRDAVIVLDEQNRIVDLNPAAQRLVNRTPSEAVGQVFTQVFSAWPELVERYRDVIEADDEVVLGEGEALRYFDLRISPLYRRNGHLTVTGRLIVLNDITEHKQAERALRESEERFRTIFEEAPIGMAIVGLDGSLLQVNKAFLEMLGYHEQELKGLNLSAITHPDDIGKDALLAVQALKGAIASYKVEKRYLKKNRETLWADLTTTLIRNQAGEAIYGLAMIENIFERKRAKLLEAEQHHVAYELHDGLAQVAASAHQHLQAFAGHYRPRSPQARQELDRALELAQRSVREARRLIAGLRPTALDDFGLVAALRLEIEALRADGWTISYEETLGSERLPPIIETTLFRVAQEALTNVHKHAHTTRTHLALEHQDSAVRLEVRDWGDGFEPSAVLHEARPGEQIGLREMRERVEFLGGQLMISSQPGAGTLIVAKVPMPTPDERSASHEQ